MIEWITLITSYETAVIISQPSKETRSFIGLLPSREPIV
jgi:hypothetical protein